MINAYDKIYLEKARLSLGNMLDYAVNTLGCELRDFWDKFLASDISKGFQIGDSSTIAGKSGTELARVVLGDDREFSLDDMPCDKINEGKSNEYWAGWALAYFQWEMNLPFSSIDESIPIENILSMYSPYHEMDISQFCDRMCELIREKHTETNLKRFRRYLGLTQRELAEQTSIPIRTIQQYEQGQKSINGARSEYIISLSKVLYCRPEELLEIGKT